MKFFVQIFLMLLVPYQSWADELLIAVASNFTSPMQEIIKEFEKETGCTVLVSYGSTGRLYTQIRSGAPFEVFLAGDETHPEKLLVEGFAEPSSAIIYAIGKLALWGAKPDFKNIDADSLHKKNFRHLAIASPQLAPYGKASEEVLKNLGLWQQLEKKFVYGENISQTYQFVSSGNAELGFVSFSHIKKLQGNPWIVPQNLYTPLRQKAILLKKSKNRKMASEFLTYLKSKKVRHLIEDFGYETE